MDIKNIGDTITFTSNKGAFEAEITGRNWNGEHIMSYVVRCNGMDLPICPHHPAQPAPPLRGWFASKEKPVTYRIEKRDYSSRPWRLLDGDEEIYRRELVGEGEGTTVCHMPFAANTKRELEQMVLAQLEQMVNRLEGMEKA